MIRLLHDLSNRIRTIRAPFIAGAIALALVVVSAATPTQTSVAATTGHIATAHFDENEAKETCPNYIKPSSDIDRPLKFQPIGEVDVTMSSDERKDWILLVQADLNELFRSSDFVGRTNVGIQVDSYRPEQFVPLARSADLCELAWMVPVTYRVDCAGCLTNYQWATSNFSVAYRLSSHDLNVSQASWIHADGMLNDTRADIRDTKYNFLSLDSDRRAPDGTILKVAATSAITIANVDLQATLKDDIDELKLSDSKSPYYLCGAGELLPVFRDLIVYFLAYREVNSRAISSSLALITDRMSYIGEVSLDLAVFNGLRSIQVPPLPPLKLNEVFNFDGYTLKVLLDMPGTILHAFLEEYPLLRNAATLYNTRVARASTIANRAIGAGVLYTVIAATMQLGCLAYLYTGGPERGLRSASGSFRRAR